MEFIFYRTAINDNIIREFDILNSWYDNLCKNCGIESPFEIINRDEKRQIELTLIVNDLSAKLKQKEYQISDLVYEYEKIETDKTSRIPKIEIDYFNEQIELLKQENQKLVNPIFC